MHRPRAGALLALVLACAGPGSDDTTTSTTSSTGDSSSTGLEVTSSSSTDATSTSSGSTDATTSSSTSSTTEATTDPVTSTGPAPFCGDGITNDDEECDNGQAADSKVCDEDCTLPSCGDGHVNGSAGEACDDGNADDTDACVDGCIPAACGDGFVQTGVEECDDGNLEGEDGCSSVCEVEVVKGCGEGGFTETWCQMNGPELPQFTGCPGGVADLAHTCLLPRIRYGTSTAAEPVRYGNDAYMEAALTAWCQTLGFAGFAAVEYGDRLCTGVVAWTNSGGDEKNPHWTDIVDGYWYPPKALDVAMCPPGDAILSVTCTTG